MKPLTIKDAETVILGLQDEIRRSGEARYDHRLHGVLLVAQGLSCPQVAHLLGDAPRTVEYWVQRFEKEGLSGLVEGERLGRPTRLSEAQLEEIAAVLREPPTAVGLKTNLWDGKTLSAFIQERYEVPVGVRQCQRLFRRLGFRLRKPRPVIARADAQRQEAYKKTPKLDEHGGEGRVVSGRSAFPAVRFPLSDVGPSGDPRSDLAAPSGPQERGLLRGGPAAGRQVCLHRQTGRFNGESFYVFLKRLRRITARSPSPVVVLADNASYHHAKLHQPWRERASQRFAWITYRRTAPT